MEMKTAAFKESDIDTVFGIRALKFFRRDCYVEI